MKKILAKDRVKGEIYIYSSDYLIRDSGKGMCDKYLYMRSDSFYSSGGGTGGNVYEATEEQKAWLNACIEKNDSIKFAEFMQTYKPVPKELPLFN